MKRIICLLLLIISTLFVSCNKDNGPKVEILVNSDIKIEINEIDDFMWKTVIFIRVDGKDMPYGNTIVKLKENEEVVVDSDVEFVVYYEYNDKTYTKVFTVRIYERINYKFLNLNYLDSNKESISFTDEFNLNDYYNTINIQFEFLIEIIDSNKTLNQNDLELIKEFLNKCNIKMKSL